MRAQRWFGVAVLGLATSLLLGGAGRADTIQLITNGGFETGDLTGWTQTDQPNSGGFYYVSNSTTLPFGFPTVGPASGMFYAVSFEFDPSANALTQSFTVTPGASKVILSFDMFVNNYAEGVAVGPLDYTQGVQFATVDLLTGSANPLSTAPADVLENFYAGIDSGSNPNPYTHYSFDITSLVSGGGTFQVRFGQGVTFNELNQGIDNVSIRETVGVPEPSSLALFGLGGLALAGWRRWKWKRVMA